MIRDLDLVRCILVEIEKSKNDPALCIDVRIDGRSEQEISYHVMILHEAGLIVAKNASTLQGTSWLPQRLTWDGHEFLDLARKDTIWNAAKARVLDATGSVSLTLLKDVLQGITRSTLGV